MGLKGLIRDSVMFAIGVLLLLNMLETQTAAILLIIVSVIFTILAWVKFIKGW